MVEFKALESTFLNWRARATRVRSGMGRYRRSSKTESTLKFESLQSQPDPGSTAAPQHPPRLPSPGVDETYYHINASDTQGDDHDHAQAAQGSQQHPPGSEPIGPSSNGQILGEERDKDQQKDSASVSHDGESSRNARDRETEILDVRREVNDLSAKRVRVRQSRMALSYKRENEVELRAKFMKHLNSFFANLDHPEVKLLRQEYELLQVATEEYVRMENSYREEEDQLEEQEYLLSLSIEEFTGSATREPKGPDPDEEEPIREIPRCVINYLSRIGHERMLQEHLAELESEWFISMEGRAQNQQFNLPLDEDSEAFLLTFDEESAKTWEDLNNTQMDVNSLRITCLEQGHSGFDYEDLSSLNLYQYEPVWEPETDPLNLPPQEQYVFPAETEAEITNEEDPESLDLNWDTPIKTPMRPQQQISSMPSIEYINKWMLHQLRISSMGIWRLQRSPLWQPIREQGWQDHDISLAILENWFSDEAALASSSYNPYLNDGGEDTVINHANGHEARVTVKRQSSLSLPSSPRASPPKRRRRRVSEP